MNNCHDQPPMIEDPEIVKRIAYLKRRWPKIGAAADHPLTEHFIRRSNPGHVMLQFLGTKTRFLNSVFVIMLMMTWFGLYGSRRWWSLLIALFVVQILVAVVRMMISYHRRKISITNLLEPLDLLRDNDPGRLDQLNLANVQFENLLGASAALYYHHWIGCAAVRAALLAIAWLVLATVIGLTGQRNVNTIIDTCMVVFFVGVGWVVCRPAAIIEAGMQDLFSHLRNRKTFMNAKNSGVLPGYLWFIMACAPGITGIIYPWLGVPGWIILTILAWVAAFSRLAYVMDHELQMFFDQCLDDGDRMFQSMLNPESSDPLEELELYGRMMQLEHRRKMEK